MFKRLKELAQLVTYKELRNGLMGLGVVFGGLGLAGLTAYAHLLGDAKLAGIAAAVSLVFVFLIIIFVIPPLARNASAEASQLNLPFEFTTGGAVFIGLMVIVAFAAWNTSNNLLFLVLSFITAALIVGFLAGHFGLKKLDVKMRFPETVYANEPTPIVVSLHSRKRFFPTFSVVAEVRGSRPRAEDLNERLKELLPEKWAERISRPPLIKHTLDYFAHVPHSGKIENQLDHLFERRGKFEIKDFELSTKFPFALFRHRRRLPAQRAEIVVFPEHQIIETEMLQTPLETGNVTSRKKGIGRDLIGMREYQPLDDLRHIDWKATARANKMIVRDFAAEDELRVCIILDTRIRKSDAENAIPLRTQIENSQLGVSTSESRLRVDEAVAKTSFLLDHFNKKGAEIRFITNDHIGDSGIGRAHFFEAMRIAATVEPVFVAEYEADSFDSAIFEVADELANNHVFVVRAHESKIQIPGLQNARIVTY